MHAPVKGLMGLFGIDLGSLIKEHDISEILDHELSWRFAPTQSRIC